MAGYWGVGEWFRTWRSPAAVFRILAELSAGRPCDFSAIRDYAMIEAQGGIQWPCREAAPEVERRLFGDGGFHHPDGRARFVCGEPAPLP